MAASSGSLGMEGRILVTSDRALNLGALSAGGNIDISTTGANALTVSGAISTAAQTASATPSGSVTLTSGAGLADRKSTRLNSSHSQNSYAVVCLTTNSITLDATAALTGNATGALTT